MEFFFYCVIFAVCKQSVGNLLSSDSSLDSIKSNTNDYGAPLEISWRAANGLEFLNYEAVDKVFLHPEVAGRKIVVISIVGPVKTGKSFFMNYCLRFLYANVSSL